MDDPVSVVLAKLRNAKHRQTAGKPEGWTALCPAHDDHKDSLSLGRGDDGRALLYCHAGCTVEAIVQALGFTMTDLFVAAPAAQNGKRRRGQGNIIAEYSYVDAADVLLYQTVRLEPKDFRARRRDDRGKWSWKLGTIRHVLYRLPEVRRAIDAGHTVYLVEGEKDADRLAAGGLCATTNAFGAGKWRPEYSDSLRGGIICILPDNDDAGHEHAQKVAASIRGIAQEVRILNLPDLKPKGDISDWLDAGRTIQELTELAFDAPLADGIGPDVVPETAAKGAAADAVPPVLPRLPESFWNSRRVLQHIRQAAHARNRSADAVLGCVLARIAAFRPPECVIDTGIGSPASLNMLVALVDLSGGGKSSPEKIARGLLPAPLEEHEDVDGLPLGTGEGLAEAYMGEVTEPNTDAKKPMKLRKQTRHNVLYYADEGQVLARLDKRNSATIGESLRRAFNGETLGQTNASRDRTRRVRNYSFGCIVGLQPDAALTLLQEESLGTPQRFIWFSVIDPSVPDEPPDHPGELHLELLTHFRPTSMSIDPAICVEIRREDTARIRGMLRRNPLDAHEPLCRLKIAGCLAILDGRSNVTQDDWRLAGVMWETSCAVRDKILDYGRDLARAKEQRETRTLVRRSVAAGRAIRKDEAHVERVARVIARAVRRRKEPLTDRDLAVACASRDRQEHLAPATAFALRARWIAETDDGHYEPGHTEP